MDVLDDPRVTRGNDNHYWVTISHGRYLVEEDDRTQPSLWWAFDDSGLRVGAIGSTDPLDGNMAVSTGYENPADLIAALLACDGAEVLA